MATRSWLCHAVVTIFSGSPHDRQMIADACAATLFEVVRWAEGAEKCPVCRQMSYCTVKARAQTHYPGSGASDNAIVID